MGRLINADALLEKYGGTVYREDIEAMPTAYDVDKVVERLEKLIINNKSINKTECENMECLSTDCIECMTLHAIKIVKGAVKDE